MRTDSFMSKLRNEAGAAKAAIGRIFDRKQVTKSQAAPAPAAVPVQPVDEAEAKAKGEGLTPKMFVPRGPLSVSPVRREMVLRLWQSRALRKVK